MTEPPGTAETARAVAVSMRSLRQRSGTATTAAGYGPGVRIMRVTRTLETAMSHSR